MTQSPLEFCEYLEQTLIPDLKESGSDCTALDFKTAVGHIRALHEANAEKQERLNDLARGLRQVFKDMTNLRKEFEQHYAPSGSIIEPDLSKGALTMTTNEIIRKHYNVSRPVTDEEVIDELVSLRRKRMKGNLDDTQERLVAELESRGMFSSKKVQP